MKKKIFFSMDTLMCGGIEKSAISLLSSLSPNEFDVTLCLDKKKGDLLEMVPEWVKPTSVQYQETDKLEQTLGAKSMVAKLLKQGEIFRLTGRLISIFREKFMSTDQQRIA